MKRLFKFLVATVTSLSLLIANVPFGQIVWADEEVGEYTFTNIVSEEVDVLSFSDGSTTFKSKTFDPQTDGGQYFPAGTITVTLNQSNNVSGLIVKLGEDIIEPSGNVCTIDTGFRVVGLGINDQNEGVLELRPEQAPGDNPGNDEGGNGGGNETPSTGYTFTSKFIDNNEELQFIDGESVNDYSDKVFSAGTINVEVSNEVDATIKTLKVITRANNEDVVLFDSGNGGIGACGTTAPFRVVNITIDGSGSNRIGILEIAFEPDNQNGGDQNNNVTINVEITSNIIRKVRLGPEEFEVCYDQIELDHPSFANSTITREIHSIPDKLEIENPGGMGTEKLGRLVSVSINGVDQQVTARYDNCSFNLGEIKDGDTIKIVIVGDDTPGGVIEWTNHGCPEDQIQPNIKRQREEFKNGSARVVGIYENYEDIGNPAKNIIDNYGVRESGALFDEYNGCLRIENGYWIAFEFVPLPGYQLKEFGGTKPGQLGTNDIKTNDAANVYYFQMPEGNCHFNAIFVEEPDSLDDKSTIVAQGNLDLSNANLEGGSGLITVEDKDISEYEDRQWENGLEAEACLSIDLDNRFLKANTSDYWNKEIHDLADEGTATIALDLGEDFEPGDENVQIIHITDEGQTEYLNTTYDPETHTVFFNTTGFSDFLVGTTKNDVPEADVPEGFTAEPQQVIDEPGGQPGNDEENFVPRFDVKVIDEEVVLGTQEGDAFIPVEPGQPIPGDAEISNRLPEDLPPEFELIYFVDGEAVLVSHQEEREQFVPGHFVTLEEIKIGENSIEIYFAQCWVVAIDVGEVDLSMSVLDKNGKEIKPLSTPDGIKYPVFEFGKAGPEDYTYFEIPFAECPNEVVVKGVNGYALFWIGSGEEDFLNTPIGENSIKYPAEDDYMWIGTWGMLPESETMNFTESLSGASSVFVGLSEDEIKDYLVVISEIDISDAPEEEIAAIKKQIADEGYTGVVFPMGFDITLFDKNGPVHKADFTVRITLVLNEELDLKDGETVVILHMLEDGFELIEAIYNAKNLTLTFETDTFSPFVVTTGTKTAAAVVSTGETVDYTRYVIASLMIAAAAATGLYLIRKKEEYSEENDPTI